MKQQRMSNEQLAQECQARAVKLDTEGIEPASAELLLGACYALTEQATRIRELEGALRGAIDHMTTCGTALRVGALSNASAVVYLCGGQGAIGAAEEARRVLGGAS